MPLPPVPAVSGTDAYLVLDGEGAVLRVPARVGPDGDIVVAGGARLERARLERLRVGQPSPMIKWMAVIAATPHGDVTVLGRVPPSRLAELGAIAGWLGQVCGVPVDPAPPAKVLGMAPNAAAAFCYMPVYAMWLVFSVASLVTTRDPHVRFAAKQSLVLYFGTSALVIGLVALMIAPAIALGEGPIVDAALVVGGVGVVIVAVARLVLVGIAAWRAWRGIDWVIPGFGWLGAPTPRAAEPGDGSVWQPPIA